MEAKPYKIPSPFKKLTKELVDKIVKDIAEGSHIKHACLSNCITHRIWDIWQQQGKIDIEHSMEDSLPAYAVLSLARTQMKEIKICRELIAQNEDGHKGAEWTLGHAYWRHYSSHAPIIDFHERLEAMEIDKLDDGQTIADLK